ncbi:PhoH family protein [Salibacter sp.]|uniref:PhoH family protein n=1 Tax=Salibacter sp. TaxID=2010995 RepID=UPI00286FDB3D|nr:PhoH family protein [Salibacter sp.]MDR9488160.1 PhoH family protein [Salibacter sp.]
MQETVIQFETSNPVEIFGVNNANIQLIKSFFPKLKIHARGTEITARGSKKELEEFNDKMKLLLKHYNRYNSLSPQNIELLLGEEGEMKAKEASESNDILVHGTSGNIIKARTINQKRIVASSDKNDLVFAIGPAGTGKTYTAVALAVKALKNKEVRRIILTRPAVEAGEHLGFLPGDLKEKLDPYLLPLYDALRDMIPSDRLDMFVDKGVIEIAPLAFMRGRTLDHAFVILDEAQNATENQMKMFLTRMGANAKFIITGDESQVDLPYNQKSGLKHALRILKNVKGIETVRLDERDVIRHSLVKRIIDAYESQFKEQNS